MNKSLLIVIASLIFSAGVFAQAPIGSSHPSIAEFYLAKDDGSGSAGDEAAEFVTSDTPIYCVVRLNNFETVAIQMNLVAVKVLGVKAETKVVSTSYKLKDGEDRVNFSGNPAGKWVAGRYRVDIFIGDAPAGSREFIVRPDPAKPLERLTAKPAKPVKSPVLRGVKNNRN